LARVARTNVVEYVENLDLHFGGLRVAAEASPRAALVLPATQVGQNHAAAILVVGISPHRAPDDEYRGFVALVAGQIASAIADGRAHEEERLSSSTAAPSRRQARRATARLSR
jgi:hypothetical protein